MNAAIYIRKSRENDDKPSYRLTVQREDLPKYANSQGWSVEIYDDGHASAARGKAEHLPERSRLENDIKAGKINIVLVIELSRLSRDDTMQDYVAWLTLCSDHQVKLATMSRTLDPSQHSDWMLLLMEGGFSSVEMKVLTGRMAEGRRQAFLSGKFLGGKCPPPYRYSKEEKRPLVDEAMLENCEKIWSMAEKMSAKKVAETLGLAEITVRRSISDDRLNFYQAIRIDIKTGHTIQCDWQPVMAKPRADRIRASRRGRKTNTERRDAAGLLSALGLFYCGYCGKTVKSWTNSKIRLDGSRLDYYACVTKNKQGSCPKSKMINHELVNEKVITNIITTLSKPDRLSDYWQIAQLMNKDGIDTTELHKQLKSEEAKKQNLVSAIADGLLEFADAKKQIDDIKSNIVEIQNKIKDALTTEPDEPDFESISLTKQEFESLSFADQREIIKVVVESITLYNTYAIIKYMFPRTKTLNYETRINLNTKKSRMRRTKNRSRS